LINGAQQTAGQEFWAAAKARQHTALGVVPRHHRFDQIQLAQLK